MRAHKNQPGRTRGTGSKAYAATSRASKLERKGDPFDAVLDARSEARYEDERGEPTLEDTKREAFYTLNTADDDG